MASNPGSWWSKDTVAVVTGANKGIGYEIVKSLAKEGLTVVLTARDPTRGLTAVDSLKAEGLETVVFHPLEITKSESVEKLAAWLKKEYGRIDILINNAAVEFNNAAMESNKPYIDYETVKNVIDTNYYGTKKVIEGLLPVLRTSPAGARIVNVTSRLGLYERLEGESLKKKFREEGTYTVELIDSLAVKYLEDVKTGRQYEEGWIAANKSPAYSESKLFLTTYTSSLANSLAKTQPEDHHIFVTTYCPGITQTDMFTSSEKSGFVVPEGYYVKTPEEGADTGVWLALLPKAELLDKNGKLFGERTEFPLGTVVPF